MCNEKVGSYITVEIAPVSGVFIKFETKGGAMLIFEILPILKEFEIIFPYLIVYFFKFTRILPYKIYFYIWKKLGNF